MDITETLYVPTRAAWRAWLAAHHAEASEIWLVWYRVHTGRPSVPYNDAVEEALCFGWIDSVRKGLDDERYAQRYTPRRAGSAYSQLNQERLARLLSAGQVHPSVAAGLGEVRPEAFEIPEDIRAALEARPGAWAFFASASPAYQRIRAAYVDQARGRPDVFEKRLAHLVEASARGRRFGYGIEAYY
ncbi:MAG: YdeI/OmpD-associated family protein [Rubricoccaceae bacterium]|nr:YdeI/OmpD-associated family protein [Rubricoccaceae bacterium]